MGPQGRAASWAQQQGVAPPDHTPPARSPTEDRRERNRSASAPAAAAAPRPVSAAASAAASASSSAGRPSATISTKTSSSADCPRTWQGAAALVSPWIKAAREGYESLTRKGYEGPTREGYEGLTPMRTWQWESSAAGRPPTTVPAVAGQAHSGGQHGA
ncbi:hypothetical protein TSOC_005669 [Tetrabaena socialis]|uniref:Uncharacterized protein n=1 Tax=Tetrabaena socialis TaxID=47790 RepID=A0A2J8A5P0_9CHLO|nr:hypothetical protein TSOC_005669 [Tetrabaena socialis]|eukprot:PNH07841.1 hypothetical protein TSOC_005669 [Tetrabaena socialis]